MKFKMIDLHGAFKSFKGGIKDRKWDVIFNLKNHDDGWLDRLKMTIKSSLRVKQATNRFHSLLIQVACQKLIILSI
jgi:hypothetical protein